MNQNNNFRRHSESYIRMVEKQRSRHSPKTNVKGAEWTEAQKASLREELDREFGA